MPLPWPKRLRAGRHMQVEPREIPLAGAPEILRVASRRIRSDFLPRRRVGESARGVLGGTPQRLALLDNTLVEFHLLGPVICGTFF
jgi:hypothetical protein